jgi:hypothetical protein
MTEVRPGVWRLCVYAGRRANGTPIQIRKTVEAKDPRPGAGRRLAERELAAMVAKVASGNVSTGSETVEDLLNAWLDHIGPNRSPTTIRKYRDLADRIVIPELGKVRLKALTARQFDRLYGKLTAKGNKATSVRRVHALIAAALHQAERWDMVDHSVARKASPRSTALTPRSRQVVLLHSPRIDRSSNRGIPLRLFHPCRDYCKNRSRCCHRCRPRRQGHFTVDGRNTANHDLVSKETDLATPKTL